MTLSARRESLATLVTLVVSTVLAFPATGLRPGQLRRPLTNGDLFYSYGYVRGQLDHGWYLHNADLAWPYGQDLRLFPILDQTHFLLLKVLGLLSSDPVLVSNAYYLLGFPMAGAAAYLFLRVVGVRAVLAVPFAVSYAILPWHTDRAVQLFLASYWVVPLGMTLVYLVATGRWDALLASSGVRRRRWLVTGGVVAAIAVGLGGVYYSLMLAFLVVLALVLRGRRTWLGPSQWLVGPLAGSILTALVLAQLAYSSATSPQDVGGGAERFPSEAERYGGRLATLLLPWEGTPGLGRVRRSYDEGSRLVDNPFTNHSLIAVAGTWLLLVLLLRMALLRRPVPAALAWLAGINLLLVLAFVTTGLGTLVAQVLPELRGWDRFSVFVALFGTAATALGAQWLVERAPPARAQVALGLVVALSSAVVLVDQAKSRIDLAPDSLNAQVLSSRAATARLSKALGSTDCPVAQYPAVPYPEAGRLGTVPDYDELLTYVAGSDHPSSYGGVRGSLAGDWPGLLDDSSARAWSLQVASAGFCAVEVLDGALQTARQKALAGGLTAALGAPVTRDATSDRTYYDLRQARQRFDALDPAAQALVRDGALTPVQVAPDRASSTRLTSDVHGRFWWLTAPAGALQLRNPSDVARTVTVTVRLGNSHATGTDRVRFDGQELQVGTDLATVTTTRLVGPHATVDVPVSTDAPGVLDLGEHVRLAIYQGDVAYDRGVLAP